MSTLIVTDNGYALDLAYEIDRRYGGVAVRQSPRGQLPNVERLDVSSNVACISSSFDLVISIHCKQLFPAALVRTARCINVHPGYNPINRGWYPQVFSIMNGSKLGVTIHEIDEEIDHGPIIVQREVKLNSWDTSGSAYKALMRVERELLLENYVDILACSYVTRPPADDGNFNRKADFDALLRLDLDHVGRFGDHLTLLRALTHEGFKNAHFVDADGRRVFVNVQLNPEQPSSTTTDESSLGAD